MILQDINNLITEKITPGELKNYSGDLTCAIEIVKKLYKTGFTCEYTFTGHDNSPCWRVAFAYSGAYWAANDSLPLAICIAALRNAGVEFKNEEFKPHYWRK